MDTFIISMVKSQQTFKNIICSKYINRNTMNIEKKVLELIKHETIRL